MNGITVLIIEAPGSPWPLCHVRTQQEVSDPTWKRPLPRPCPHLVLTSSLQSCEQCPFACVSPGLWHQYFVTAARMYVRTKSPVKVFLLKQRKSLRFKENSVVHLRENLERKQSSSKSYSSSRRGPGMPMSISLT